MFKSWCEKARADGLKFRIGRWNIVGHPIAILVDFTLSFLEKDSIFAHFWETYKLDSLSGQWDYVEPALFGFQLLKLLKVFINIILLQTIR